MVSVSVVTLQLLVASWYVAIDECFGVFGLFQWQSHLIVIKFEFHLVVGCRDLYVQPCPELSRPIPSPIPPAPIPPAPIPPAPIPPASNPTCSHPTCSHPTFSYAGPTIPFLDGCNLVSRPILERRVVLIGPLYQPMGR